MFLKFRLERWKVQFPVSALLNAYMKRAVAYLNNWLHSHTAWFQDWSTDKVPSDQFTQVHRTLCHSTTFICQCYNVLMTNEMNNFYNQFLFHSFLSALHVSKDSSRSSSGAQHNILYYTVWYNRYNRAGESSC